MKLGERIVQAREALGWSRKRLAKESGVPYPTLAGIENSDQQTSTATPQLAAALGVNAVWLATGNGPRLNDSNLNADREQESHLSTPNIAILHEALTLLFYDEKAAGDYPLRPKAERLAELYARVAADGGELSKAHNSQFVNEVRARAKGNAGVATTVQANRRRTNSNR